MKRWIFLIAFVLTHSTAAAESPATAIRDSLRVLRDGLGHWQYRAVERRARALLNDLRLDADSDSTTFAEVVEVLAQAAIRGGVSAQDLRPLVESAVRIRERQRASPEMAVTGLQCLAALDIRERQFASARERLQRVLAIQEPWRGSTRSAIAETQRAMGVSYEREGNRAEAERYYRLALATRERILGPQAVEVAESLSDLGNLLHDQAAYADALPLLERALALCEPERAPPVQRAFVLNNLARVRQAMGDHEGARRDYERSLEIRQQQLAADDPAIADASVNLGSLLKQMGQTRDARRRIEGAVRVYEAAYGPVHRNIAIALLNLGGIQMDDGDFAAAESTYARAVRVLESVVGPEHPMVGMAIGRFGNVRYRLGDFLGARERYERGLAILEKTVGPSHPEVAGILNNLGNLLDDSGDIRGARIAYERALQIMKKVLGPDHEGVALVLSNLADGYRHTREFDTARRYYADARRIYEKAYDSDHYESRRVQLHQALLEADEGHYALALANDQEVLRSWERRLGPRHPEVGAVLANIATALADSGALAASLSASDRAAELLENGWGADHPDLGRCLAQRAEVRGRMGDREGSMADAIRAENIGREHVRLTARALPEQEALKYAAARPSGLGVMMSLAGGTQESSSIESCWDAVIRSRSLVLEEMALRQRMVATTRDPDLAVLAGRVTRARRALATVALETTVSDSLETRTDRIESARREKDLAERLLGERSSQFREEQRRAGIGAREVRAAMPARSAMISYVKFMKPEGVLSEPMGMPQEAEAYAAIVARPNQEARCIPLGSASSIDSLIRRCRLEIASCVIVPGREEGDSRYRTIAGALRQRIWDPVARTIGNAKQVLIVADGALHLVDFAALPTGRQRYLIEDGPTLRHLSSERDLVADESPVASLESFVGIGSPAYDAELGLDPVAAVTATAPAGLRSSRGPRDACADAMPSQWPPLPGTGVEIVEVSKIWSAARSGKSLRTASAKLMLDEQATEAAVIAALPGHRVVHIATHGYFNAADCGDSGRPATVGVRSNDASVIGENPLLLSGLILTGANRRHAGTQGDDGILTAEELVGLDLRSAEWVVLSACETGLGQIRSGEGVHGLRRALQIAGSRTVITSLWRVDDDQTRRWMRTLYAWRFGRNQPTAIAMSRTCRELLRERRRAGLGTHPRDWAGFVAVERFASAPSRPHRQATSPR